MSRSPVDARAARAVDPPHTNEPSPSRPGRARRRVAALLSAIAVGAAGILAPVSLAFGADQVDGKDLLYRKHVDSAHASWTDGHRDVSVVDGQKVRPASEVAIRLGPDADSDGVEVSRIPVPSGKDWSFLGKAGSLVWSAPQTPYADWAPVWPGLGAGEMPDTVDPESISMNLVDDGGPGTVEVYRTDSFGRPDRAFSSKPDAPSYLRTMRMKPGAHGHYNWAFTKPGKYDMKWQVKAKTKDGKAIESPIRTVTWYVGTDEQVGLPKGSYKGTPITKPATENPSGPSPEQPSDPDPITPAPDDDAPDLKYNPTKDKNRTPEENICTHVDAGHLDVRAKRGDNGKLAGFIRWDKPSGGQEDLKSRKFVIEVPSSTRIAIPNSGPTADLNAALRSDTAYQLPEIQDEKLPWMGFSTEDLGLPKDSKVQIDLQDVGKPIPSTGYALGHFDAKSGKFAVDMDSSGTRKNTIPTEQNTHLHRAQFFSQQGFYTVYYDIKVTHADGKVEHGTLDAFFAVGDAAIANSCERDGTMPEKPQEPEPTDPAPTDPGTDDPGTDEPTDPAPPEGEDDGKPDTGNPGSPGNPGDSGKNDPGKDSNEPSAERIILEQGHTDIWSVTAKSGKLDLALTEDITGQHIRRAPESVELHVNDKAKTTVPKGFPGAGPGYFLPQSQLSGVLWPGWDTLGTQGGGVDGRIDLAVTKVTGPGSIKLFGTGTFGQMTPLLAKGQTELKAGAVRQQPFPAHTHANWVFTKPGVYTVTVQARGKAKGKAVTSKAQTYTFTVGSQFKGKTGAKEAPNQKPGNNSPGAPGDQGDGSVPFPNDGAPGQNDPGATGPGAQQPGGNGSPRSSARVILENGHTDVWSVTAKKGQLDLALTEDITGEHVRRAPEAVELHVNDKAKTTVPKGLPGAGPGYLLPQSQLDGIL